MVAVSPCGGIGRLASFLIFQSRQFRQEHDLNLFSEANEDHVPPQNESEDRKVPQSMPARFRIIIMRILFSLGRGQG
jgi:hypothetical protein